MKRSVCIVLGLVLVGMVGWALFQPYWYYLPD